MSKQSGRSRKPRKTENQVMRDRLMKKLPAMLDAAIAAYQRIALADPIPDDPKSTAANHAGAKAILGHIDQILKLAEATIDISGPRDRASGDLEAIIEASRNALCGENDIDSPDLGEADDPSGSSP